MLLALLTLLAPQDTAHLSATFVDEEGAPLAGVVVRLTSARGAPAPVRSDREGRVDLHFVPAGVGGFVLRATAAGRPEALFPFRPVPPGAELALGRVVLARAGVLVGRVVDQRGDTQPGAWLLRVSAQGPEEATRRQATRLSGAVDPASGEFRIEGVPAGAVLVEARDPTLGVGTSRETVQVDPGAETFVELRYEGPPLERALALDLVLPHAPRSMAPVPLVVTDRDGGKRAVEANLRNGRAVVTIYGLGPGPYALSIDDERLTPVRVADLRGRTRTRVDLRGGCTLLLEVVEGGAALTSYGLKLGATTLVAPGQRVGPTRRVEGLLGGPHELELTLPGRLPFTFETPALVSGAPVRHTVEVCPPRSVDVDLLDSDGRPTPGVTLELTRGGRAGTTRSGMSSGGSPVPQLDLTEVSDAAGHARFTGLFDRPYTLRARFGPYVIVDHVLEVTSPVQALTLAAPPTGELVVHLRLPEGLSVADVPGEPVIEFQPEGITSEQLFATGAPDLVCDGLTLGPVTLPAGRVRAMMGVRIRVGRGSTGTGWWLDSPQVVAGETTEYTVDLRASCPARLEVELTVDGAPPQDLRFEPHALNVAGRLNLQHRPDGDNRRMTLILAPGDYLLEFFGGGDTWFHSQRLTLAPGEVRDLRLDLERVTRRLRLVDDGTGLPLGNARFPVALIVGTHQADLVLHTDEDGTGELSLSPGKLYVDHRDYLRVEVDWAATLPQLIELRMKLDQGG